MDLAESKSVRPAMTIRPRTGRTMPAIACTMEVLPDPDRPKSATIGASAAKAPSNENVPLRSAASSSIMVGFGPGAAHEALGEGERREGEDDREDAKADHLRVLPRHLRERIDRERERLRLAPGVPDDRDGRAEFAQRAREGEDRARDDAGPRERQRDREEDA